MKRIVVTGTGTSIGKTHLTCAIARAYASQKQRVAAFKPVETGIEPAGGDFTDSGQLAAVSSFHVKRWLDPVYTFREPLSPHLAARRAGISLELRPILDAIRLFDDLDLDVLLVELAGGLFSPLNGKECNADLALALHQTGASAASLPVARAVALTAESGTSSPPVLPSPGTASGTWTASGSNVSAPEGVSASTWSRADSFPPNPTGGWDRATRESNPSPIAGQDDSVPRLLLVAPDRIGVLHEISASVRAADAMGLPLAGIVLVSPQQPDASTGLNGPEIPYVTSTPYLGTLRRATSEALAVDLKLSGFLANLFAPA